MEPLPDLASLSDDDLKQLIDDLKKEEKEVSYRRRLLHGQDRHPARRARGAAPEVEGGSVLDEVDVDRLTEILAAKAPPPDVPGRA